MRPQLLVDGRYTTTAGLAAVLVGALMIIAALLAAPRLDHGTPPPTTYIVSPDGDNVELLP